MDHWIVESVRLLSQNPYQHSVFVISGFLSGGNPFFDSASVGMA